MRLLLTGGVLLTLVGCGAVPYLTMAHPDNPATQELEWLKAETAKAKRDATAAWLMLGCQSCVLRDCYRVECSAGENRDCERSARAICEQAGCHRDGNLQSCIAFTESCRAQDL